MGDYWDEAVAFFRSFFDNTFKSNSHLYRGIITGITRISKESIFSDLNNLDVVITTSNEYALSFGFTENEVFQALDDVGLGSEKENVKIGMMDLHSETARIFIIPGLSHLL